MKKKAIVLLMTVVFLFSSITPASAATCTHGQFYQYVEHSTVGFASHLVRTDVWNNGWVYVDCKYNITYLTYAIACKYCGEVIKRESTKTESSHSYCDQ